MIKHFCDVCKKEVERNFVNQRFKQTSLIRGTRVGVEIIVGIDDVWNAGDICDACLGRFLRLWFPKEET